MSADSAATNSTPEEEVSDPTPGALQQSLRAMLPSPSWGNARVTGVRELTPGLSGSRVFRVSLAVSGTLPTASPSVILKIPDWGTPTGIASRDPWVRTRERHFYESGLAASLPEGVRAPALLGIDRAPPGRGTWLWTEDEAGALDLGWRPADAITAAARVARLHDLFRARVESLEPEPWLEREGYGAYQHHVPAAHRHLERLSASPRWSNLLDRREQKELHHALDLTPRALQAMRRLPPTLVHGDFHIGNLGLDRSRSRSRGADTLVAVDWTHVGVSPLGCDVATLVSLYSAMGGGEEVGDELEEDAKAAYVDALGGPNNCGYSRAADLPALVSRACGLWHLTWGLHLRLGPGLDWLLRRPDQDSDDAERSASDIRRGCLRALAALAHL